MARRRELKGICRNLAHKFNGRNNDFLGYWAIGQLYSVAKAHQKKSILLNLLTCKSDPSDPKLAEFATVMHHYLLNNLASHGVPLEWIGSANVTFRFKQPFEKMYHYWRSALGKPYIVELKIRTDLGNQYFHKFGGNVRPHDPNREHRRAGF